MNLRAGGVSEYCSGVTRSSARTATHASGESIMLRWTKGIFDTEEITVVRMREQDEEFCKILRVTIEKGSIGSNARLIESISDGRNDLRNAFSANSPRTISARS